MPTDSRKVLVVGGAGFIGSHMVALLRQVGYSPIVLDNLSTGHQDAVPDVDFIHGDMGDQSLVDDIFKQHAFSAVFHFASCIEVGESIQNPLKYYQNNVGASLILFNAMLKNKVKKIIFSSSAAVYGDPQAKRITESHQLAPVNPYGRSKLMIEEILRDLAKSNELNYVILRYFNAAGADPSGKLGERHQPESHLIPLILHVASGQLKNITVFGNHHQTADGTCIRDYVHVADLCHAHLLAFQALQKGKANLIYNLGTGNGYSVLQVIKAATRVTGKNIASVIGPERKGDPATLVADATLAKQDLNWQPRYSDLDTIIAHAWQFMNKS